MNDNAMTLDEEAEKARTQSARNSMSRTCWHCGADQRLMQVCAKCDLARYCSSECARAHYVVGHAPLCSALTAVGAAWRALLDANQGGPAAERTVLVAELVAAILRQRAYNAVTATQASKDQD